MQRRLTPEILDSLGPDDPAASHSRRDLRVINLLMGNHRWFARVLPGVLRADDRILEIGAGSGELCRLLTRRGMATDGLDQVPRPLVWPEGRAWHRADLRDYEGYKNHEAVLANLILHHFSDAELVKLGQKLRRGPRLILACEPARRMRSQALFAAISPIFGANRVTRHDANASISAGFLADELPRILGLDCGPWKVSCEVTLVGAYRMAAVRQD
jgi:2-polyprenyl-3-methyl-5-hydroxy-6-metoxy-1,4-benzoquinol methylase